MTNEAQSSSTDLSDSTASTQQASARPRNLVVCSDGTGNRAGKARGTNVWKLYEALDRNSDGVEQMSFYDDGVGSADNIVSKVVGGAFGFGLARNVQQLYSWLARNYEPGDRIYLFGFSRGAFTVRCLAGMISSCGLLDPARVVDGPPGHAFERMVHRVWLAYKALQIPTARRQRQAELLR